MAEEIDHVGMLVDDIVVRAEFGNDILHRSCPLEVPFVDKYSNGLGCKAFCHGPEIVDGVSVTLDAALDIPETEALPINDLAVMENPNGDSSNASDGADLPNSRVQSLKLNGSHVMSVGLLR
jgi:hypothetical protein